MRPRRGLVAAFAGVLISGLVGGLLVVTGTAASGDTRLTPGNFSGFGFDKCDTPSQAEMDAWLTGSQYWAVGVYISGDMRACKTQANLTSDWVATQAANGWKILPLTVGPQASCYISAGAGLNKRISPNKDNDFQIARMQGRNEAKKAVYAAKALGISAGSTIWYDLEAFDVSNTRCRLSALAFLSAWTWQLHHMHWESGVYSSGASGILALDQARLSQPGTYHLPDYLWFAVWNYKATVQTSYISGDGWLPHGRMHQYEGGHTEKHGGVKLTIDSNFLDLGNGSIPLRTPQHCNGVNVDFPTYPVLARGDSGPEVLAAQCLLTEQGFYHYKLTGKFGKPLLKAVRKFRVAAGFPIGPRLKTRHWAALLSAGDTKLAKYGSYGEMVRRLQRALNAVLADQLPITGTFAGLTRAAVREYQAGVGLAKTGVVTQDVWDKLATGQLPTTTPTPTDTSTTTASPTPTATTTTTTATPTS